MDKPSNTDDTMPVFRLKKYRKQLPPLKINRTGEPTPDIGLTSTPQPSSNPMQMVPYKQKYIPSHLNTPRPMAPYPGTPKQWGFFPRPVPFNMPPKPIQYYPVLEAQPSYFPVVPYIPVQFNYQISGFTGNNYPRPFVPNGYCYPPVYSNNYATLTSSTKEESSGFDNASSSNVFSSTMDAETEIEITDRFNRNLAFFPNARNCPSNKEDQFMDEKETEDL